MASSSYRSQVTTWMQQEESERKQAMWEMLRAEGEAGDTRYDANTVYNMSTSALRKAVNEHIDAEVVEQRILDTVEAAGGDVEQTERDLDGKSPVEVWEYLRELDKKAVLAQLTGGEISSLPLEDALRHAEASLNHDVREQHTEALPGLGLDTLSDEDLKKVLEKVTEAALRGSPQQWADVDAIVRDVTTNPVQKAVDEAGISAAAEAVREKVEQALADAAAAGEARGQDLETAVREGMAEGGAFADKLREDLEETLEDLLGETGDVADRLGKALEDLLDTGVLDLNFSTDVLAETVTGVLDELKQTRTPNLADGGTTGDAAADSAVPDPMNPNQQGPRGTPDGRSAAERTADMHKDILGARKGDSGGSTAEGGDGGGTGATGGTGGVGGGFDTDTPPLRIPDTSGGSGSTHGGAAAPAVAGTPTDGSGDSGQDSWLLEGDTLYERDENGIWTEDGAPVDQETAERLEAAWEGMGDAAPDGEAAREMDYTPDPDGGDGRSSPTPTGRILEQAGEDHRQIREEAAAGSTVNPVREGGSDTFVGSGAFAGVINQQGLQQPPSGEDFVEPDEPTPRGTDYGSSTGAGVINDPDMRTPQDGLGGAPADLDVGRPDDLSHLAPGGVEQPAPAAGPPDNVDPADLRLGDPLVADVGVRGLPGTGGVPDSPAGGYQYVQAPPRGPDGPEADADPAGANEDEGAGAVTEPIPAATAPTYAIGDPHGGPGGEPEEVEDPIADTIGLRGALTTTREGLFGEDGYSDEGVGTGEEDGSRLERWSGEDGAE